MLPFQETEQSFFEQFSDFFHEDVFASWEFWVVLSGILLIGEVLTAGFLLGAFVPGTLLAALFATFGWSMEAQLIAFATGTVVGLLLIRPFFLRRLRAEGAATNVQALVGSVGRVTEAIDLDSGGRVKVQSEEWKAACSTALAVGAKVRVLGIEGNTLQVEAVD